MKKKTVFIALTFIILFLCAAIVLFFQNQPFIRGFLGDMLIVMLFYTGIKSLFSVPPVKLSLGILVAAFLTEFLQLCKIIPFLGFQENLFTRLVFGSVFDPWDLLAYLTGVILIFSLDSLFIQKTNRKQH